MCLYILYIYGMKWNELTERFNRIAFVSMQKWLRFNGQHGSKADMFNGKSDRMATKYHERAKEKGQVYHHYNHQYNRTENKKAATSFIEKRYAFIRRIDKGNRDQKLPSSKCRF